MNKTALIIGPEYFNYPSAVAGAFRRKEWEAEILTYDTPVHPYDRKMRIKWKLASASSKRVLYEKGRRIFNIAAVDAFDRLQPSIVFIMNGEPLMPDTLMHFRKNGAWVALWLFDSMANMPGPAALAPCVDKFYCFEKADVERMSADGHPAGFLPQACDTDTYRPLGLRKTYDICFVGNIYGSAKRKAVIDAVVKKFHGRYRIRVWGRYIPWYKDPLGWLFMRRRWIFRNRILTPVDVNVVYNSSHVVLNIHNEAQTDGANPRTFEICGSEAYQICDANPYIESRFPNGEIGLWHNEAELFSLIEEALSNKTAAAFKAAAARDIVLADDCFDNRIDKVIADSGITL